MQRDVVGFFRLLFLVSSTMLEFLVEYFEDVFTRVNWIGFQEKLRLNLRFLKVFS
jgi:hypothetical protein